jgi:hypothetical protein
MESLSRLQFLMTRECNVVWGGMEDFEVIFRIVHENSLQIAHGPV